jgi:myo-inositol catabolism protein IolS
MSGSRIGISRIGLGGYPLGPEPEEDPDVPRAVRVLEIALENGVNWLDTSENYLATRNEELIGEALAQIGDDVLVASKVAPGAGITGLHWPDDTGVPLEETWGAMAELAAAGLVREIGMSNYSFDDVARCHAQRRVDAVQVGLNLIDYVDDRAAIAAWGEMGIVVTIFEPLASGILTGRTLEQVRAVWTGPWREAAFYKRLLEGEGGERSFAVVDGLIPIAARLEATPAQVAIAWVLHQPGVASALAGSRNGDHMRENAGAAHLVLPREVLDELEELIPLGPAFA